VHAVIVRLLSVPPDVSCSSALLPVHLCRVALLLLSAVQPATAAVVVVWCAADLSLESGLAVDSHELKGFQLLLPASAAVGTLRLGCGCSRLSALIASQLWARGVPVGWLGQLVLLQLPLLVVLQAAQQGLQSCSRAAGPARARSCDLSSGAHQQRSVVASWYRMQAV
jgi:hypothetical protein